MGKEWRNQKKIENTIDQLEEGLKDTRESLKTLLDKGYIKKFKNKDGEWRYKSTDDPKKLEEAKKWSKENQ